MIRNQGSLLCRLARRHNDDTWQGRIADQDAMLRALGDMKSATCSPISTLGDLIPVSGRGARGAVCRENIAAEYIGDGGSQRCDL